VIDVALASFSPTKTECQYVKNVPILNTDLELDANSLDCVGINCRGTVNCTRVRDVGV